MAVQAQCKRGLNNQIETLEGLPSLEAETENLEQETR
jgi:hypothetical protein